MAKGSRGTVKKTSNKKTGFGKRRCQFNKCRKLAVEIDGDVYLCKRHIL